MAPRGKGPRTGPMSLLVLAMVLCLAVLCALCLATARADLAYGERQLAMTADAYANEAQAQQLLARLDAAVTTAPEGADPSQVLADAVAGLEPAGEGTQAQVAVEGDVVTASFVQPSGRSLDVAVSLGDDGRLLVESWVASTRWEETPEQLLRTP